MKTPQLYRPISVSRARRNGSGARIDVDTENGRFAVPPKCAQDNLSLDVPNVHRAILRRTDDPLATARRMRAKRKRHAKSVVSVAVECLDANARSTAPKRPHFDAAV